MTEIGTKRTCSKCRLCLKYSKNVMCIFDICDGTSYADIVTTIANVKISKDDGITDRICLNCRRRTKELYDFKLQVERSFIALQENCCLKRVNFTNISDIKFSIEITENDFKNPTPVVLTENLIKSCEEPFNYNNTVIKKIPLEEKKPLSVIDFLNSIKEENEDDYSNDYSYEVEVDYDSDYKNQLPSNKKRNKKKRDKDVENDPDFTLQYMPKKTYKRKNKDMGNDPDFTLQNLPKKTFKKKNKENQMVLRDPIKPVFLADYALVPAKPKPREKKPKKDKCLICPYCGKLTKTLKVHLLVHSEDKPFKCDKCAREFVLLRQLNEHIKKVHSARNEKCDICVAVFPTKEALKSHMKSHSSERKHLCEICSKPFKLKTHMLRHVRLVHSLGAKPWKCELCTDTFSSKYTLNHHMRVHTGERPYKCEICSQPYSYKHDFNRHCLNKHGVCFKRRTVHVLNEEVLLQEKILMRDLMLRFNGILKDDKPINPFEGPQSAMAFDQMIKAIQSGKIAVDFQF